MAIVDINTALGKNDVSSIISASNKNKTAAKATTDRGTPIVNGKDGGFDKNSFLKILSAQLSNLDPSANQDSTAYVTQMAQFASMEQMCNLNDTMSSFAYQQLIGKGVTMDVADNDGKAYTGIVRGVSKEASGTYLSVEVNENGKNIYKKFDVKKLQSVLGIPDYTSSNMMVNSDFSAASALVSDKDNKVVISDAGKDGKTVIIKGTIKSAFIDNGVVKIRVETMGEDGKSGGIKVYPYGAIMKAGNLTEEDMDVKVEDTTKPDSSTNTEGTGTKSQTGSTSSTDNLNNIDEDIQKLTSIAGK